MPVVDGSVLFEHPVDAVRSGSARDVAFMIGWAGTPCRSHDFLAEMLGVQRSTVSVVTRSFQTAGLIRQSRGGITVTDREGLEGAACECYSRIRRLYERLLPGTYT